jgi:hypothetical protein
VLLEKGGVALDGAASEVADYYQASLHSLVQDATDLGNAERYGTGRARFASVAVTPLNAEGAPQSFLRTGGDLGIDARIAAASEVSDANAALIIYDSSGYRLIDVNTALQGSFLNMKAGDEATVSFRLRNLLLKPGVYFLGLWLGRGSVEDIDGITYVATFTVEADPEAMIHTETFPGVYQCRYEQRIEINGGAQAATRAL